MCVWGRGEVGWGGGGVVRGVGERRRGKGKCCSLAEDCSVSTEVASGVRAPLARVHALPHGTLSNHSAGPARGRAVAPTGAAQIEIIGSGMSHGSFAGSAVAQP